MVWAWAAYGVAHAHFAVDTTKVSNLKGLTVVGQKVRSQWQGEGGQLQLNLRLISPMPQLLGTTDPLRYTRMFPGVQTGNEYDAGLYVQGCDNSHNDVMLNDVPVYHATHFLGIFSIFNTPHFSTMLFQKHAVSGQNSNRLGAYLNMLHHDTLVHRLHGDISVGPIASQATLRLPAGKNATLTLSGRAAYLNLFYSKWLQVDETQIKYGFSDYNLTWLWTPSPGRKLWIDAYMGNDNASIDISSHTYNATFKWDNHLLALHYLHPLGKTTSLRHSLYFTRYRSRPFINRPDFFFHLPSQIQDYGYRLHLDAPRWSGGVEAVLHHIQPQKPDITGGINMSGMGEERYTPLELSAYADRRYRLTSRLQLNLGIRSSLFLVDRCAMASVDPGVNLVYNANRWGQLSLYAGWKHQYLHRAGFTAASLPTEFWFPATRHYRPQRAFSLSTQYDVYTPNRGYKLSVSAYYKHLNRQVEYVGTPLEMISGNYHLENHLLQGRGHNFGTSLMIEKRRGKITGWLAYSWGRALRSFLGMDVQDMYPAAHERQHEVNQVIVWHVTPRLQLGETLVFATGTPFTAPTHFYYLGGNLIAEFGPHHGERLKPYLRADLSLQYMLPSKGRVEHGFNFSLYNITARKNELLRTLKVSKQGFAYRPISLAMPLLPSISYFYRF